MKKVLVVLAEKMFREIEYIVPRAFFEQNGIEIKTVSSSFESVGRFGFKVKNDFVFSDDLDNLEMLKGFDGICFIGGVGSLDFMDNLLVKDLAKFYFDSGKIVSAICAAPRLLLNWGILNGVKCTGNDWDKNFGSLSNDVGAIYECKDCISDKNVVTANGPNASEEFALEIIKLL